MFCEPSVESDRILAHMFWSGLSGQRRRLKRFLKEFLFYILVDVRVLEHVCKGAGRGQVTCSAEIPACNNARLGAIIMIINKMKQAGNEAQPASVYRSQP